MIEKTGIHICWVAAVFLWTGCQESGVGRPVPGVVLGMAERDVIDRLGEADETLVHPLVSDTLGEDQIGISTLISQLVPAHTPGDTIQVRESTWSDVQRWPWEAPRTWNVLYVRQDETWQVLVSTDLSEGAVAHRLY